MGEKGEESALCLSSGGSNSVLGSVHAVESNVKWQQSDGPRSIADAAALLSCELYGLGVKDEL
jgi:hypothetical protein